MPKSYITEKTLKKSKKWPESYKGYTEAHEVASKLEKKKYGKSYEAMKKIDDKLKKGELAGHNTKEGKIEISKKIPKKYRTEVAFHEKKEYKELKKLESKRKKH